MSMGALPVYLMFALFLLGVPVAIALIACVGTGGEKMQACADARRRR